MTTPNSLGQPPTIAVLVGDGLPPPDLTTIDARVHLRMTTSAHLADALDGADALLLWDFFSSAVREVWGQARALKWIHVAAAGVDTLLFDELRESDVVVTNAQGVFDRPIAEFVLASILAQLKQLHLSRELQLQREWRHRETGTLSTEHVLVVGTGAIGRETGRLLGMLGATVRGAARSARTGDPIFERVVSSADLARHIGWADHVVIAAPLTSATRGMFGSEMFAAMKPGAHLVNIGRGPIVDEAALLSAVQSGQVGLASLDVFDSEPLPSGSALWAEPNVVVSPHMSGDTVGWRDVLAQQFVDNCERWLDGLDLNNVVDKRLGFVPPTPR